MTMQRKYSIHLIRMIQPTDTKQRRLRGHKFFTLPIKINLLFIMKLSYIYCVSHNSGKEYQMTEKYDLDELLENPHTPLTKEQLNNWPKYMAMTNDDIPANEVDISDVVEARIREINEKGTYWFL